MPSFESILLSAHPGFIEGCMLLNELTATVDLFQQLAQAVINKRKYQDVTRMQDLSRERATLEFIERACCSANPVPDTEEIVEKLSSITNLSEETVQMFALCRAQKSGAESSDLPQNGKLIDLQWRLGLAVESSTGRNLNSIYVTMSFKVLDSHNRETIHTLELPYQKFQEFVSSIKVATLAMDSL